MSQEISDDRRRLFCNWAMAIAATPLGVFGSKKSENHQSSTRAATTKSGANTSFAALK